jgi:toxin YhaV
MARPAAGAPLVINGWTLYAHPLFLDQLEVLIVEGEGLSVKGPKGWVSKNLSNALRTLGEVRWRLASRR